MALGALDEDVPQRALVPAVLPKLSFSSLLEYLRSQFYGAVRALAKFLLLVFSSHYDLISDER